MRSKIVIGAMGLLIVSLFVFSLFLPGSQDAYAAPLGAPTPQTFNPSRTDANVVTWANAKSITADTRWCADVRNYNGADVQWIIDQGTVNTTTLKLQFSNDNVNFVDGATLVSANAADANSLNRQLIYGRWVCVYADLTNSNAIVITAIGVAK